MDINIASQLPSLAICLAFCVVVVCAIAGFRTGTSGKRSKVSTDTIAFLVICGIVGSIIAGLLDWAVIYNQGAFELSMLCWLFISSGFFSIWLGAGLAVGPVEQR